MVVDAQGRAHLIDLLDESFPLLLTAKQVKERYFANDPWSVYVIRSAPSDILSCALAKLETASSRFPVFRQIPKLAKNLDVGLTEAYFEADRLLMLDALQGNTLSSNVKRAYQVPVAIFEYQTLILNERLYNRMNAQDQCALMTHELLRLLNFYLDEYDTLNTDQIEATVRFLFLDQPMVRRLEKKLSRLKLGDHIEQDYHRYLFETTDRIDEMRRQPEGLKVMNISDFNRMMDGFNEELKGRMELIRAKDMQRRQRLNPEEKQDGLETYLWNEEFSKIIRGKTWRGENASHPGHLNVITLQVKRLP